MNPDRTDNRIAFHSLGCKVNRYETDAVAMRFLQAGYREVPFNEEADVYLVNTCTVTGEADRKSRQILRRARTRNPDAVIVAMGCHVEATGAKGLADILIGCDGRASALERVEKALVEKGTVRKTPDPFESASGPAAFEEYGPVTRQKETRAHIKIQDGCDDFCAYCAIPLARGRARSREPDRVLDEARALAETGFAEIVLTGIHISAYGTDFGEDIGALARLTRKVAEVPGICRVRLGSLDPQNLTGEFVDDIAGIPGLCPHFHLSLQSGSKTVLDRMGRAYSPAHFTRMVDRLRHAYPGTGITTDIIVGFPGETEAEHRESLDFCRRIGFSRMHVFRYSKRPGTRAADMPDQVNPEAMARRAAEMGALAAEMGRAFAAQMDGLERDVLIEQVDKSGAMSGYTPEYVHVRLAGLDAGHVGRIVRVRLESDGNETLLGRLEAAGSAVLK